MKPACWEACFLYPCPTVEHSNNCLLLLCVLFLKPSGHYTKITNMCSDIQTAQNGFKYITLGTIFIAWGYLQGGGTSSFSDIASSLLSVTISPNKINSNGDKVSAPVAAIKEDNSTIVNYDTGPGTGTPKIRCNVLVTGIVL